MKKIFKFFLFIMLFKLILSFGFLGWVSVSIVGPALKGTDITFIDLLKRELDPIKYKKLDNNIRIHSESLSKASAQKIKKGVEKLFPAPDFNYADILPIDYPFIPVDEVMKSNEASARKGVSQGLKYLK